MRIPSAPASEDGRQEAGLTGTHDGPRNARGTGTTPAPASPPRWTSAELLRGAEEVLIEHESSVYRLRLTSQGKLILTK